MTTGIRDRQIVWFYVGDFLGQIGIKDVSGTSVFSLSLSQPGFCRIERASPSPIRHSFAGRSPDR